MSSNRQPHGACDLGVHFDPKRDAPLPGPRCIPRFGDCGAGPQCLPDWPRCSIVVARRCSSGSSLAAHQWSNEPPLPPGVRGLTWYRRWPGATLGAASFCGVYGREVYDLAVGKCARG